MMHTVAETFPLARSAAAFRPVIITPTYNNAHTLARVLDRLTQALPNVRVIAVNDGATDATAALLQDWQQRKPADRCILTHRANRGKAAALCSGFTHALASGYSHAATIDTDDQLWPEDLPRLLQRSRSTPDALILGVRDVGGSGCPARSRIGRHISNCLIRLESGARVDDSQCGLRVYPLHLAPWQLCRTSHFGFETEVLTRCAWAGVPIVGEPVRCRYLPPGQRVSHFRPIRETARAIVMHGRLLASAMSPWGASSETPPPSAAWPAAVVRLATASESAP